MRKKSQSGEIVTFLTIGTFIVIAASAILSSFVTDKKQTTSSRAVSEKCIDAPVPEAQGASYWEKDCSKSCSTNADCPQNPQDPDPSTSNWCYLFGDGMRCMMRKKQQSSSSSTSSGGGGGAGGECFKLSTEVYADKSGADWKFNAHVKVYSPDGGKDGHIQLFINDVAKGTNWGWYKGANNPFDIEPQYTDSPTLGKGQSKTMRYKIKVDECAPLGNEHEISCTYSVNAAGQPVVEGGGCECTTGNCGSATPEPTNTPKPGIPTSTPKPGLPTSTPKLSPTSKPSPKTCDTAGSSCSGKPDGRSCIMTNGKAGKCFGEECCTTALPDPTKKTSIVPTPTTKPIPTSIPIPTPTIIPGNCYLTNCRDYFDDYSFLSNNQTKQFRYKEVNDERDFYLEPGCIEKKKNLSEILYEYCQPDSQNPTPTTVSTTTIIPTPTSLPTATLQPGTWGVDICRTAANDTIKCKTTVDTAPKNDGECTNYGWSGKYKYAIICGTNTNDYQCIYNCWLPNGDIWQACSLGANGVPPPAYCDIIRGTYMKVSLTLDNLDQIYTANSITSMQVGLRKSDGSTDWKYLSLPQKPYSSSYMESTSYLIHSGDDIDWVIGAARDDGDNLYYVSKKISKQNKIGDTFYEFPGDQHLKINIQQAN